MFSIVGYCGYSQTDTAKLVQFVDLIAKVENDRSLNGEFMYKGEKADIFDDQDMKTAIGKFITIKWGTYSAVFHTVLGYMTRARFTNQYHTDKRDKITKWKFCSSGQCAELRDDLKEPYIIVYRVELRELN